MNPRSRSKVLSAAVLGLAFATLAIAPTVASAKKVKYAGPIDQVYIPSPAGFSTDVPSIQMKVDFDGKVPKLVVGGSLREKGAYGSCVFGTTGCNSYPGEAAQCYPINNTVEEQIKIKKRKFSITYRQEPGDTSYFTATGRVGKNSVTGTIHLHSEAQVGEKPVTCDTGVITYTVPKV